MEKTPFYRLLTPQFSTCWCSMQDTLSHARNSPMPLPANSFLRVTLTLTCAIYVRDLDPPSLDVSRLYPTKGTCTHSTLRSWKVREVHHFCRLADSRLRLLDAHSTDDVRRKSEDVDLRFS